MHLLTCIDRDVRQVPRPNHDLPHGVRCSGRAGGNKETSPDRTRGDRLHQHSVPAAPAAALNENEPGGSGTERRKTHVDTIVRDWSST